MFRLPIWSNILSWNVIWPDNFKYHFEKQLSPKPPRFLLTARRINNLNSGTNSITFVTFHRNIPSKKFKNIGPIGTTWNPPIIAVWNPSALFYPKEFWNVLDWDPKLHPFSLSFLWTMNNAHSTRNNVKFVQLTNTFKHLHC